MNEKETKAELRKTMLAQRTAMHRIEKSRLDEALRSRIQDFIHQRKAHVIHTYLPFGDEPDIYPLIQSLLDKKYKIICPKSLPGRQLENLELRSLSELEEGRFGTKHPANSMAYTDAIDLFIVPGLAFDSQNYRLGFGSGYYDTFFATQPSGYKLGICYPFQIINNFPVEPHDVPLNEVIY